MTCFTCSGTGKVSGEPAKEPMMSENLTIEDVCAKLAPGAWKSRPIGFDLQLDKDECGDGLLVERASLTSSRVSLSVTVPTAELEDLLGQLLRLEQVQLFKVPAVPDVDGARLIVEFKRGAPHEPSMAAFSDIARSGRTAVYRPWTETSKDLSEADFTQKRVWMFSRWVGIDEKATVIDVDDPYETLRPGRLVWGRMQMQLPVSEAPMNPWRDVVVRIARALAPPNGEAFADAIELGEDTDVLVEMVGELAGDITGVSVPGTANDLVDL
jgi:hypothetical protein